MRNDVFVVGLDMYIFFAHIYAWKNRSFHVTGILHFYPRFLYTTLLAKSSELAKKNGDFSLPQKRKWTGPTRVLQKLRKWHVPGKKYVRKIQTYSWKWKFPIAYR